MGPVRVLLGDLIWATKGAQNVFQGLGCGILGLGFRAWGSERLEYRELQGVCFARTCSRMSVFVYSLRSDCYS